MRLFQLLSVMEVVLINLVVMDRCCHHKYNRLVTLSVQFFSVVIILSILYFLGYLSGTQGSGEYAMVGFIFLIPLNFLYKESLLLVLEVMCMAASYTMGIFVLSIQISYLLRVQSIQMSIFFIESGLICLSFYPFFKWVLPKYIFVLDHMQSYKKNWHRFFFLYNIVNVVTFLVFHIIGLTDQFSVFTVFFVLLLLITTYLAYFVLYQIMLDTIAMHRLEHEMLHDTLTGLGNRKLLMNDLATLLHSDQVFSVLFMDLNQFKKVNDQYGHLVGDQYLKHFSDIASRILQKEGAVYRFGGDEFVAIYRGVVSSQIIGELRVCKEWSQGAPCPFNQVSVGSLILSPPHPEMEQVLKQVDQLMYQNKAGLASADSE